MKRIVTIAAAALLAVLIVGGVWTLVTQGSDDMSAEDEGSNASSLQRVGLILLEEESGVTVLAVMEDSPAARCGLQPGDKICRVGGEPVTLISQVEDGFSRGRHAREIAIVVGRDDEQLDLLIQLKSKKSE